MKNITAIILASLTILFAIILFADENKKKSNKKVKKRLYMGVDLCKYCHRRDALGNQYGKWLKSKHAAAYKTLKTKKAKEVAKKLGIKEPEKSTKCLKCHITAHGVSSKLKFSTFNYKDGVQCETCHGAGEDFISINIMKNEKKAMKNGLKFPTKKDCLKCHNKESPTYKKFDYKKRLKEIPCKKKNKKK